MTTCDLFEREGLLQIERGVDLDPHFDTCPDCLDARRRYAQLTKAIAELDAPAEPSPWWQTRVWATIQEQQRSGTTAPDLRPAPPRRRRWTWWLAPVGAIAAVAVFFVWGYPASTPPATASLAVDIYFGQAIVSRGQEAKPGDELRLRAVRAGFAFAELRVYFNDTELSMRCSTDPPCRRDGDALSAVSVLQSLGTYRPILIVSAAPIPEPTGNLNQDAGAAIRSGATVRAADPIAVR